MPLSSSPSSRPIFFAAALIVVAGALAYANSLHGPFVFDDPSSIVQNPTIRDWSHLGRMLATPHAAVTVQGRPVLNLSLALNYALGGTSVEGYHLLNLLIHLAAGLTLFGVVRRTLGEFWPALAVALLWVLHPLQTESVTYVIQRAESLMGLFYLLTLYGFIRYQAEGRQGWAALCVTSCFLGMGTKEVMVSAPLTVLLYDRIFVSGSFAEAWRRRRGLYCALASSWVLLAGLLALSGGNRGGAVGLGSGVSWWDYAQTQFLAVTRYLELTVWPHPLVFEYGTFWVEHFSEIFLPAVVVLALGGAAVWALWRGLAAGFLGWGFFAILAPTSLMPGTTQMIVEHRMYLALAPVLVLAVWGARRLAARAGERAERVFGIGVAGLAVGLGLLTWQRNQDYRDVETLWRRTLAERPRNVIAHTMLGQYYDAAGRTAEAQREFEAALAISPRFPVAQENLGEVLFRQGHIDDAIGHYREALASKPDYADAHANLGAAFAREHRAAGAEAELRAALALQPENATTHYNLANVLADAGHRPEAIAAYREALRLDPQQAPAHFNLANTLADAGQPDAAIAEYQAALRLQPAYPQAEYNLGNVYIARHQLAEAATHYEAAVRLRPGFADARNNLGSTYLELGRLADAAAQYEAVLRLQPAWQDTRTALEAIRAELAKQTR